MPPRCLGPGSLLPSWLEELERETFQTVWGPLDENEWLLILDEQAFIRWRLIVSAGEAELLRIAVAPSARHQGLARRLLTESERRLAHQGITELHLEVRTSNTPARRLYETQGWHAQGIRKAYYGDGEDAALYMRKIGCLGLE